MKVFLKRAIAIVICIIFSTMIFACGSKKDSASSEYMNKADGGTAKQEMPQEQKSGISKDEAKNQDNPKDVINNPNRKLIKTGDIQLETLKFDEAINNLNNEINKIGGYVESSNIQGKTMNESYSTSRYASFSVRIPSDKFDSFLNGLGNIANMISKSVNGQDVTSQYVDTEARLKSLKIQEERFLELMKNAKDVKDIIELEKSLTEVRYQIESLTGALKQWDNLVEYSTINIGLNEVSELSIGEGSNSSLGDKVVVAFKKSIRSIVNLGKGTVVFVVAIIPYLIILVPIGFIMKFIMKKKNIKFIRKEDKDK